MDDPSGGLATESAPLIDTGTFTVVGVCDAPPGTISGSLRIRSATTYSVGSFEGENIGIEANSTSGESTLLDINSPDHNIRTGTFSAMSDNDEALQGWIHATIAGPNTCRFAASGIGE